MTIKIYDIKFGHLYVYLLSQNYSMYNLYVPSSIKIVKRCSDGNNTEEKSL